MQVALVLQCLRQLQEISGGKNNTVLKSLENKLFMAIPQNHVVAGLPQTLNSEIPYGGVRIGVV